MFLGLLVVLLESILQSAGFKLLYFVVAAILLVPIWVIFFEDTAARQIDAALAREAAKHVVESERALLAVRLASDELLIATDQRVLTGRRGQGQR